MSQSSWEEDFTSDMNNPRNDEYDEYDEDDD